MSDPEQAQKLWIPGEFFSEEVYPVPTTEQLTEQWQAYTGKEAQPLQGVYGVYTVPPDGVCAVASIDLCEVVRDTAISMSGVVGETIRRGQYSTDTWCDPAVYGRDYEYSVVLGVLQAVMNETGVPVVDEIQDLGQYMKLWRQNNIYIVANTSTLPGCEKVTIELLENELKGCFDALVLPRNHHGDGPITKAKALGILADEANLDLYTLPLFHIDDATHHVVGFTDHFADHPTNAYFIPAHNYNSAPTPEMDCENPLEAFKKAHEFLRKQGVLQ